MDADNKRPEGRGSVHLAGFTQREVNAATNEVVCNGLGPLGRCRSPLEAGGLRVKTYLEPTVHTTGVSSMLDEAARVAVGLAITSIYR